MDVYERARGLSAEIKNANWKWGDLAIHSPRDRYALHKPLSAVLALIGDASIEFVLVGVKDHQSAASASYEVLVYTADLVVRLTHAPGAEWPSTSAHRRRDIRNVRLDSVPLATLGSFEAGQAPSDVILKLDYEGFTSTFDGDERILEHIPELIADLTR